MAKSGSESIITGVHASTAEITSDEFKAGRDARQVSFHAYSATGGTLAIDKKIGGTYRQYDTPVSVAADTLENVIVLTPASLMRARFTPSSATSGHTVVHCEES